MGGGESKKKKRWKMFEKLIELLTSLIYVQIIICPFADSKTFRLTGFFYNKLIINELEGEGNGWGN